MYAGRQRDLRERRAHQDWDTSRDLDPDGMRDADDARELDAPGWGLQLNARASAA
jgi:hypothetical protein